VDAHEGTRKDDRTVAMKALLKKMDTCTTHEEEDRAVDEFLEEHKTSGE
jgi:hypothetical protein